MEKLSERILETKRIPLTLGSEPVMSREEIATEVAQLEEALEGIRDLARTSFAPMAFNMTPRQWDEHRIIKIASEAHLAITKAKEIKNV